MAVAQDLSPCAQRAHFLDPPWVEGKLYCLELVIEDASPVEMAYTALAAAPDGTLYATRPVDGQVVALTDSDGDGLPDHSEIVADGLTLPNGLAWHEGALYIAAGSRIYRLRDGTVGILIDDLPVPPGDWAGDIAIGPDERLYVSVGGACDNCVPSDSASILSFALDGTDRHLEASGLRQAAGLAFRNGVLWATDSARYGLFDMPQLDELDRVTTGAHFGWPYCVGADNLPDDLVGNFNCQAATAPAMTFPTGSTPLRLAAYTSDVMPQLTGTLLATLNGSRNRAELRGYALVAIHFDQAGVPTTAEVLIPRESDTPDKRNFTVAEMNYRTSGFWPHRPLAVAAAPEGWVYISVSGGRIMALRPKT